MNVDIVPLQPLAAGRKLDELMKTTEYNSYTLSGETGENHHQLEESLTRHSLLRRNTKTIFRDVIA